MTPARAKLATYAEAFENDGVSVAVGGGETGTFPPDEEVAGSAEPSLLLLEEFVFPWKLPL